MPGPERSRTSLLSADLQDGRSLTRFDGTAVPPWFLGHGHEVGSWALGSNAARDGNQTRTRLKPGKPAPFITQTVIKMG